MSKPSASKLLRQGLPVPGGRRAQYSASTRRALLDAAERLFAEQGYAGASLDVIAAEAEVTKGALYHHFNGKRALFETVFERVEAASVEAITKAMKAERDPWDKALAGLGAFLATVQQPGYRRIVVQEGPAVLGYAHIREQEERSSFAVINETVRLVLDEQDGEIDPMLLQTFSSLFFGAMSAMGEFVADSDDPAAASRRVEVAIGHIFTALRLVRDAGVELPGPDAF